MNWWQPKPGSVRWWRKQAPIRVAPLLDPPVDSWRANLPAGVSYGSIPAEDSNVQFAQTWWRDYYMIRCVICDWRIGTCGLATDLDERRANHAEVCRMPDSKPEPCGRPHCIKCHP